MRLIPCAAVCLTFAMVVMLGGCVSAPDDASAAVTYGASAKPKASAKSQAKMTSWKNLFDGKSLGKWKVTDFHDTPAVTVVDGAIQLPIGNDMTGITLAGDPPSRINYEIEIIAMKVAGNDFFTGLTFPIGKDYLSLIVGGWGGGLVGLSSINGMDASENDTSSWREFEPKRWYTIRLRVTEGRVEGWIDNEKVINRRLDGETLSTRIEVESSKPLGISTWRTHGAIKSIRWRGVDGPDDRSEP
jgi:hypothetical protein